MAAGSPHEKMSGCYNQEQKHDKVEGADVVNSALRKSNKKTASMMRISNHRNADRKATTQR
jgi:hypothetical protein